jgi:hypothetical protein
MEEQFYEYIYLRIVEYMIFKGFDEKRAKEIADDRIDGALDSLEEDINNELEYVYGCYVDLTEEK